ncbi:glycosyl hydrolase 2 galactose-binding domain-containing protein [Mucilaginibacter sp. X5P1]|uniref:glycoside hydrolase family 2 protein n=1 Tax=Mucilaginibacter sp. X5P1 TaxID=2723088 RepID=UPI001612D8CB|nr:glycoside hydrolase family 2 protein [Mucilaginibacter sp. X5P1]MBB6136709.1 exo-1,4-beta-D-glucosaminidase [Mucilaginibacter sp. X5P1]
MKKYLLTVYCLSIIWQSYGQSRKENFQMILKDDWKMQSAITDPSAGEKVSQDSFKAKRWYNVSVPTTILAGLIANKVYSFDPFYGQNFKKLNDPRLDHPWWFRRVFELPASQNGKTVILRLHGINYKANVWLNGVLIADSTQIKGPFRIIQIDVTKHINSSNNTLAIEVLRPFNPDGEKGDLAIDYADWIHYPPDYNGGIVNNIEIKTYNKVGVQYPLVTTKFDLPSIHIAHLSVDALVTNYTAKEQDAILEGTIDGKIKFEQKVHLKPNESRNVSFYPADYPQLNITDPKIWWPWQYGKPELNHIKLTIVTGNEVSNTIEEDFGIREITSKMIDTASRMFIVNGEPIMLRGAAWSPDIFQRRSEERQEQEVSLVRDMHMNIIRSEGKLEDDHFYDLCDKYGMLVMTGYMCCGTWQHPENWDADKRKVAMASDSSIMYWFRNKACMMTWLNGSDMPPTDTSVERGYLNIEKTLKYPNPILSTANEGKSKVSGYSGVKMAGPYEWVPPIYWETDTTHRYGGMYSFATEISPGPSIPPYESLIKFIPKNSLWYTSADWQYHCGTHDFGTTNVFNTALNSRYGQASTIKNYLAKAQAQNYEAHRAMMEAYGLNKYHTATGVVQWMLSNPWPGLIWHTYDYYLYPAGTYFGMKKSMEPLHVMYSYRDNEVDVTNSLLQNFTGLTVQADVYNLDGTLKYNHSVPVTVSKDSIAKCFKIPAIDGLSDTYLLRLQLSDKGGSVRSINWYWLAKTMDKLNWEKSTWYITPQSGYADYSALQTMPKTPVNMNFSTIVNKDSTIHQVVLTNTGKAVAFFVHLRALKGKDGDDILPVIFSDNYISLAPGERRIIKITYATKDAKGVPPYFITSAWNLDVAQSKGGDHTAFENGLPVN